MKESSQLRDILRELLSSQKFAALATQGRGSPHNCLVAFAATDDLRHLLFATSRETVKYRNIMGESRVAILVDSRANQDSDFSKAIAVTASGTAKEVKGKEKERLLGVYLVKHTNLSDFANSPENALVKVMVNEYEVSTFQSTHVLKLR
jgi:heme iron utilization protein